jgi:hypothetical protein
MLGFEMKPGRFHWIYCCLLMRGARYASTLLNGGEAWCTKACRRSVEAVSLSVRVMAGDVQSRE